MMPRASAVLNKTRLIIFDLNNVLCNIEYVNKKKEDISGETYVSTNEDFQYGKPALIKALTKESYRLVTARPYVRDFVRIISRVAHVGVWTCMRRDMAVPIVQWLFGDCKPAFVLSQEHCSTLKHEKENVMVRSKNSLHEEYFKELPLFWKMPFNIDLQGFIPSEENTLLVDDSPLKSYLNPPGNCVFPHPWRGCNDEPIGKELAMVLKLCQQALSVPEFVESLMEDANGSRIAGQNPVSKTSPLGKSLERFTRVIRPSTVVIALNRC